LEDHVLEVEPAGEIAGGRLAVAVNRDRLGVETARSDGVAPLAFDDEGFALNFGRRRLRSAGRAEEWHELLDSRRGVGFARPRRREWVGGGQVAGLQTREAGAALPQEAAAKGERIHEQEPPLRLEPTNRHRL